ncbi:protein of unknown function [Methylococcus capsulatus]|uniref:Uncharacterized protein n=1 Tax=Methylococcus capsulatus TaxID=414 RepID=A0AA35UYP3_METCP|nr:protein of unknown function [Methylococcus capsulatus]
MGENRDRRALGLGGLGHLRRQRDGGSRLGAANRGHTAHHAEDRLLGNLGIRRFQGIPCPSETSRPRWQIGPAAGLMRRRTFGLAAASPDPLD